MDEFNMVDSEIAAATPTLTLSGATGLGALKTTTGYQGETAGYFTVKGTDLTAKVTVTAPTGFVVCDSENGTYASSIDITAANAMASAGAKVYVKMSSSASGTYSSKSVTVASSGATSKTQSVSGTTYAAPGLSSTSGSASVTQGDIPEVTVSDYKTGSGTMTYSIKTAPAGVAASTYDLSSSTGWLVFDTDGVDSGTYTFVVQVQNAAADTHGTETYTWTVTVAAAASEYTWSGTGTGWYLKGDWNGWGTTHEMKTDANFGSGNYSRTTVNNASGSQTFKWHDGSFWIGYYTGCANPVKNTVYVPGGGSWGDCGNFTGTFTSGKYYTFRGKFYANPSNAGERMNDFVIMETTGAPTEFVSAGAGNPSGTLGAVDQTVSVTLNQVPNSEETVYVRYTTDNWANSATVALTTGTGTTRSGTIPAQSVGTTVSYYFLTTTVPKATLDSNPDLCTLNGLKNGANNWSYTVAAASVTASAVSGSALTATHPNASSGYQTFTVSGSRLTEALTVTAPSGFAICSTAGGTYVNELTLTPSGTALSTTTVYVKLAANTSPGSPSGNVSISGGGLAANVTVAVSGTVKPAAPTVTITGETAVSISGTVTCLSGATVKLRRYTSSSDASSDSTGTGGTAVSTTGSGTSRTFTDSGRDACTTYYYKAWQTSGGQTSVGSTVQSQETSSPGEPDVEASGSGGVISLSWDPVPGAASYKVNVCEVPGAGTSSRGAAGEGLGVSAQARDGVGAGMGGTRAATGWVVTLSSGTFDTDHITWTDGTATITQEKWGGTTAVSDSYISAPRVYRYHALVLDAGEGNKWVSVSYTVSGSNFGDSIAWGSSDSAITSANYTSATAGGGEPTYSSGATSTLTFSGGRYAYIYNAGTANNVQLRPTAITATYEPAQSCVATDVSVSGTSVTFDADDGVETGKTYSWSVASVGAGGCDTEQDEGTVLVTAATPTMAVTVGGDAVSYDGTVAFGNVGVGSPLTKTFTVANTGSGTLTLGTVGVTAGQGFTVTGPESGSVAGSGSTTFTVTFTPTVAMIGAGQKSATVSFTHNDGSKTTPYRFTVTATATGGILAVDESAGGLAFGNTPLDSPKTATVTIRNTGNAALTVGSVSVTGTGFALVSAWSSQTIAAGGSTTVSVRFAPASAGDKTGTLTVTASGAASGSPATVSLTGKGLNETTGNIWIKPLTTGNLGTKTVGDTMSEYFLNFEIGQESWNKSEVGIGLSTGTVWGDFNWADATYYEPGQDEGNKRVRRDLAGFQFTQAGQYNVIYAAKNAAADNSTVRCAGDWVNYTTWLPTDFGETYFTVEAVPDPTVTSATAGYETVALRWSLDAASHPVMIVRYTGATPTVTAPTPGQHYESGATIGAGTVVYREYAGTSVDTAVAQGTTYTYVLYSVNNGYYSAGARTTVTSSTVSNPSVGVTTAGAGTLTGGDSGVTYVVARNTTGTFDANPTGAGPNQGGTLGTGANEATVVYRGTATTFTDSTAVGCNTYYYKVWAKAEDENAWSAGSLVANVTMATPAAPMLNTLASVTYQGFTASWNAVPGAATYRMDIVEGSGGATTTDTMTSAWTGATTSNSYEDWSGKSDQSGAVYAGATAGGNSSIQMNVNTAHGIWTTTSGGTVKKVTVTWNASTGSGRSILIYGSHSAMSSPVDGTEVGSIVCGTSTEYTFTTDYEYVGMTGSGGGASYASQIEVDWATGGGTSAVAGWTDKDVGSIMTTANGVVSVAVTGLDEQTTYSVVVRSEGATSACKSGDSNSQSATTLVNPSVTGVTISDADGAGGASAVAAGDVAAGQTALVQGSKLVVANGTVNPVLTGVTFATTGTATGSDIGTVRVRVGTNPTYAGTETVLGTATYTGAGSYTVSGSQTLTKNTTYYVWIEAVTAAGAAGGSTVKVSAMTGSSFAITNGRKTGGTTAAGEQTIGNLTAFTAATGATLGGQIGLTWTAGASGTLTVRWSTSDNIPGPGTPWANETTGLTGGTSTLTGLTGCQGYYLKAWEVVGGTACGGVWTATATASAPAAPTGLGHGTPGAHDATLTWTAGTGATGYSVDVWHFEGGSGGGSGGSGSGGIEGTYTLVTDDSELTAGNYVIVGVSGGSYYAMTNATGSTFVKAAALASSVVSEGGSTLTLTEDDADVVWNLENHTTYWTIKNGSSYVIWTESTSKNESNLSADSSVAKAQWSLSWSSGDSGWEINNHSTAGDRTHLRFNNPGGTGDPRFACYSSGQTFARLYKQSGGSGGSGTGTKMDDVVANATAPGATAECTVSGTGATLTHLTDGTTYYWTVKSLGEGGCAGGTSSQDSFTTAELLGVPTIGTPLTAGVGQLSGTVTGKAGATLILKRYDTEDLAGTGTAWGLDGTVVSAGETTPGSGVWTFTDTGLDGCTTYWYKAWQWEVIDGDTATSGGSAVASAQTALAAPTVSAVGAGTQLTVNWLAVPGAASYKVQISDTPDTWTVTAGGEGDAVLTEDFSGFTADSGTEISDSAGELDDYTSTSGWTGYKVFCNSGSAKIGAGAAGNLTTPSISAMPHGGKVYFDLKKYSSDTGNLMVKMSTDGGSTWTTNKTFTPTADWQTGLQADIPEVATAFKLRFETTSKRAYLDNVRVVPLDEVEEGTGRGLIYESTTTDAPASRTKTGLTIGQLYYYRVVVTGSEGCVTEAGGSETTADAPIIEVMPTHYNFGTVTKNSGEHTAEFVVRNAGNVPLKFSAVSLVQDGDAYSFVSPAAAQRTADLAPGAERTYKVQFNPQTSGSRPATLRFSNDAYNTTGTVPVSGSETYANTDIPLSGMCFDPATADPDVLWLSVKDGLGVENTVWDDNMAHSATQPVLEVTAYHYNGMAWASAHSDWANWTLYDAEGTVVPGFSGLPFDSMTPVTYDGRSCSRFTAKIPALGAAKTYRGKYKVGVTLKDSSRTYTTTTTEIVPIEQEWLLDDFARADAVGSGGGALGNSWVARASSGSLPSSAAIRNASLELYGPGGGRSGTAGRVAAGRDMSDERYPTTWSEFTGSGSWGFHFKTGAKTVSWADGSTAGAFVLGATHVAWFTPENAQKGVAVMFTNDCVRLVRFEKSLLAGGTITDLTTASYNGTQGKWLAVRVDYIPGQPEVDADESDDGQHHDAVPAKMRLYVKPVAGPGGNPVEECTAADLVETADVGDTVSGNLKFGGAVWNHGTAQLSETTGGTFDDLYVPHMDGEGEPMEFHVIDEDVEGPEFYGFSIRGAIAAPDVASDGLTVTGMVHDASGLSGTVGFKMYNGDTLLASGSATPAAVAGSSTEFTVSFTIAAGVIDGNIRSSNCRFEVTATDGDDDRSEGGANIDAMEGTASYPFTFCASTPTAPGWATAEIDGAEMVVLRWARSGGTYVVVRSDTEIGENSSPQGRTDTMAVGTTVDGWGTVVYNDTGDNHLTGTWTAREFIVAPGSTNYFAVYGMTGDAGTGYYFSAPTKPNAYAWATTNAASGAVTHYTATDGSGVPTSSAVTEGAWPCVTPKYEPGEGVDSFEYRTSVTVPGDTNPQAQALAFNYETRPETGCGWGGPWTGDTRTWKVHDQNLLTTGTHFPTPAGNKLYWEDTSSSSSAEAYLYRPLASTYGNGKFFVAGLVNFLYGGNGKYVNIVLVDDEGHDLVSFGKQGGSTGDNAAIYIPSSTFGEEHTLSNTGSNSDYGLTPGHGQDYVIAGELDWENKMVRMWVFYGGAGSTAAIPQVYDDPENKIADTVALEAVQASWSWATDAPSWAGKVAGIKLVAGSDNTGALGHVYFDEIRFAQSWPELFLFNDPEVYTYDFDKPEEGTGRLDPVTPTDADGHNQWQISDGALAHGDVGLNAQFGLFHRTGIQSASFTILDSDGNHILMNQQNDAGKTAPESGGTPASVTLSGASGSAYSDWKTPAGGATGSAVPTNWISLDETYTVEVTLTSAGGRQAVVTAASETGGGGATDLFIGEYGEGAAWDKYIELYNGTGHDIDLYDYYLFRPKKDQDWSDYSRLIPDGSAPYARLSSTPETHILHHKETIVLLNTVNTQTNTWRPGPEGVAPPNSDDFLAAMEAALTESGAKFLRMPKNVLDAGGKVPYLLIRAEDFDEDTVDDAKGSTAVDLNWLDACGLANLVLGDDSGRYVMSRKETATHLPRSKPLIIDPGEWDYRRWSETKLTGDDWFTTPKYTNLVATAGQYDRNIGLGGDMEFKVFDDDTDAPAMSEGGIRVGSGERLQGTPGDRTYVMGGWSFTNWPSRDGAATNNLTLEEYKWITEMWPYGMTTRGGVSWSPLLGGDDLSGYVSVIEAGNNKGESNAEFDGITQRKYGCMVARASGSYDKADEVWLGFDLDTSKLSEAVLSFGYAGGSAGFANARVEVSTTGQEGTFTHPTGWEFDPKTSTQNATTWAEWSGALADAGEAVTAAGHLWFRVVLKDYAKASGTFRLDNIRLEGAPEFLRVSDQDMNTQTVALGAIVSDANSGLDAGTATFTCGLADSGLTADTPTLVSGGKGDSTFSWRKTGGFSKAKVQEWYEKSQEGKTQLRMSIADKDDDRPGDATTMSADFGTLDVYDDDDDPPTLEMATMKPRKEGTMAKWLLKEKTRTPSETMDGLDVGDLGLDTTAGTTSNPRYSLATNNSIKAYAVYQSGWQAGSKYWTATIKNTTAGAGTITRVKFWSKVGSVLAPTGYDIQSGTVAAGETEAETTTSKGTGSLLTSGPWVKEGAEGVAGSPIKEWAEYSKDVTIPIAAGETLELRIFGTGADADGIGATWYLWGLEFEGSLAVPGEGGEDGYTYVTDNSLAGGGTTLTMSGNVWDESGLAAAPTYSLTNAATGTEISSGTVSFTSAGTPASRTTKALGEFSQNITLSSMGYGVQLAEYKGGIHAEDADYDREDGSGNNTDKSVLDGQFAFTVVDQDLVGPTAPTGVKVNGVDVPNSAPNRNNVAWTNQPEFTVSFNVANDIVPTETELTSADEESTAWRAAHGITNGMVKKASAQTGAAGVGEYRVALPVAGEAPTAAAMSNAPAYSVAVTNGALANYGFERFLDSPGVPDKSWSNPDGDSGINKGNNVGGSYPVAEGTSSYYLRAKANSAIMSQVIPFEPSASAQTLTMKVSLKIFKRAVASEVCAKFEFSEDGETWRLAGADYPFTADDDTDPKNTWLSKEMAATALTAEAGDKYLRFSLYSDGGTANIDDVRLSVRVGSAPAAGTADRATMRYLATVAGQGLDVKYLFAVDADNDRPQDRRLGDTAVFYTAYDVTPPTPVALPTHDTAVSTDNVEDPTSQFDVSWSTSGVGPDDNREEGGEYVNANYKAIPDAQKNGANSLSPWYSYKFYYKPWDPAAPEVAAEGTAVNYINKLVDNRTDWTGWDYAIHGKAITDPSEVAAGHTAYVDADGLNDMSSTHCRIYDLENDQDYIVVAVGVDKAGNEGPATTLSWATNNTIKFEVTKGYRIAKDKVPETWPEGTKPTLYSTEVTALEWTAAGGKYDEHGVFSGEVKKDYDLLYWDAGSFNESANNPWALAGTVRSNWFVDDPQNKQRVLNRNTLAFYRASYKDRWMKAVTNGSGQVTSQVPLASEDVYSMATVTLTEGYNYVSLQGTPYTNTFAAVFGTEEEEWPCGTSADASVQVQFYSPRANTFNEIYYLNKTENEAPRWCKVGTSPLQDVTDVLQTNGFFTRPFAIVLPDTLPERYRETTVTVGTVKPKELNAMHWHPVMHVPTNATLAVEGATAQPAFRSTVECSTGNSTAELYNPVALNLPVRTSPANLGLPLADPDHSTAGFRKGKTTGDRLYILDSETKETRGGSTMYCDEDGNWRWARGDGLVGAVIQPNDMMVIITRGGSQAQWTWTYKPSDFYTLPDRHMGVHPSSGN